MFDEAEGLFGSRTGGDVSRHDIADVGILLHHIETYSGICIVVTNLKGNIDKAFLRRFRFVIEFKLPTADMRANIFKLLIPPEMPVSDDIDFKLLGERYEMSGGHIKSVVMRAAIRCALRKDVEARKLTMKDLLDSCKEEMDKDGDNKIPFMMYS